MLERTLAIIKPDAVKRKLVGKIISKIEEEGFNIRAMKVVRLSEQQARGFYYVHQGKSFYDDLVQFMISAPVVLMILEADNAISRWRKLMGATNPDNAEPGTIRKEFAESLQRNSVHGSDAPATAAFETAYFFNIFELV